MCITDVSKIGKSCEICGFRTFAEKFILHSVRADSCEWITKLLGRTGRTGFRDVGLGRTDRDAGLGLFDEAGLNIDERVCVTYTVLIKKRTNFSINSEIQYLSFLILLNQTNWTK
ncbi:unnamed protein product [Rhizophagus irregularis]|nr:unnamed protein product [Rhizophagus irregularis]CAB4419371.1 unnamed protein product [Rhizophagus irregularis]